MRALALPAAIALSLCLYMPFPSLREKFYQLPARIYAAVKTVFDNKQLDPRRAPITAALVTGAAAALIAALHPVLSAIVMAPLFTFSAVMPACAKMKDELDSGTYVNDIPTYEAHVRTSCLSLYPAFLHGCFVPLLLVSIGMPLYLGPALGYLYVVLRALPAENDSTARLILRIDRAADKVFSAMLMLCAGLVGRNPLRIRAENAQQRLIRTLGIAGDRTDTHAPMAGDIAQGIFVCSFAAGLLCLMLTLVLLALC